jgi:heme-degrading monooxygenase HmoA
MLTIIWEFEVRVGQEETFVAAYRADGAWARLFSRAEGYRGTRLLRAVDSPGCYVTIDTWDDASSFARFQQRFGEEYRQLDLALEACTLTEKKLAEVVDA